jgi:5-methylthioribose kinase
MRFGFDGGVSNSIQKRKKMSYKILTIDILKAYILNIEVIKNYLEEGRVEISEIGDGNLNFVYIVTNVSNGKSLIVKQAVPYLRIAGEGFPLSRERMNYEIRALQFYEKLLPSFVPKIYYADEAMSLVIMENLSEHIIMRKGLIEQTVYPKFSEHISTFLAHTLFYSSSLYLNSTEKRALVDRFNSNVELCKLTEDFVFTLAFMDDETNDIKPDLLSEAKELFLQSDFKKNVLKLKYIFMTQSDALLYGDLHTGSIMLNADETYVIDPEFAFVGAFGFDIGALIANMINAYISHFYRSEDEVYQAWILESIQEVYTQFEVKFLELWSQHPNSALLKEGFIKEAELNEFKAEFMKNIFSQSVGFAGCKIVRRVFGIAGVEDIRGIEDKQKRKEGELMALSVGKDLILNYEEIESVDGLILRLRELNK